MENICNLNWSWYTIRVPPDNLQHFTHNLAEGKDVLFCHLNEIEPKFLAENEEIGEDDDIVLDPRNKTPIQNFIINQKTSKSPTKAPDIFPKFPTKSSLSQKQHEKGLRVLNANQNKVQASSNDLKGYNETVELRNKEYNIFTNFLKAYFSANFKEIWEIGQELLQPFQQYLQEIAKIMLGQPDRLYSLQTALPLHYNFQEILPNVKPTVVFSEGMIAVFKRENNKFFEFKKYQEDLHDSLLQNLDNENIFNFEEYTLGSKPTFDVILPENTLLTLLNALSNDLDFWEIPVRIEEKFSSDNFSENNKLLLFCKPLPNRVFNMKNTGYVYEDLLECHVKLSKQTNWLDLCTGSLKVESDEKGCDEIAAVDLNQTYKIFPISKYIDSIKNSGKFRNNKELSSKNNMILVEWNLSSNNDLKNQPLKILTKRRILFCEKQASDIIFLNMSFKLEYKRRFGAEIMTKSELIKEWIKQYITPNSVTERVRIDAKTFEPILQQRLSASDTEDDFLRLHNIKPIDLLNSLYGFLTTLLNFPLGEYLLKCDPKHKDKIMVFSKTLKGTDNALSIHQLYKDAGGISYTNEAEFIPIDNCVIMPMHLHYSVLPSCFPHWGRKAEVGFNDRSNILQKFKSEKDKKEASKNHFKKQAESRRKALRATIKNRKNKQKKTNEKKILESLEGFSVELPSDDKIKLDKRGFEDNVNLQMKYQQEQNCGEFDLVKYMADASASISNCANEESVENKTNDTGKIQLRPRRKK